MKKQCEHNWKKIYYRKKGINEKKTQEWTTISNKFICDKCLIIKELK